MVHVRYGVFAAMAAAGCVIGLGRGDVARDEMQRQVDAGLIAGGVAAGEGMAPVCVGLARVAWRARCTTIPSPRRCSSSSTTPSSRRIKTR